MTVISTADRIKESFEALNRRDLDARLYFNRLKLHKQLGLLAEELTT